MLSGQPLRIAEPPPAVSEDLSCRLREETLVKRLQILIRRLLRAATEEDRKPYPSALELPFVEELGAGEGEQGHRGGTSLLCRKGRRCAGLVVILQETDEPVLVGHVGQQVQPHALGVAVLHPIVELLVVTVVESLLLERPFQIPIGLGQEPELRVARPHCRDKRRPIVLGGPVAGP